MTAGSWWRACPVLDTGSSRRPSRSTTMGTVTHDANGIGPTVELVLGNNGHAEAVVNGNGRHDEAPEPQQSLFSWAEFMAEEPVKPKGRGSKPQPATASLFDWALTLEREREEEPVGLLSR